MPGQLGYLELPLACEEGHTGRLCISLADPAGWNVRVEIDHRVVLHEHCSDWHRVERLHARVAQTCPNVCTDRARGPGVNCRPPT